MCTAIGGVVRCMKHTHRCFANCMIYKNEIAITQAKNNMNDEQFDIFLFRPTGHFKPALFDRFLKENDQKQPKFDMTRWRRLPE